MKSSRSWMRSVFPLGHSYFNFGRNLDISNFLTISLLFLLIVGFCMFLLYFLAHFWPFLIY